MEKTYGKEAFKLITELEMSTDIKPFNEFLVEQVLNESKTLYTLNRREIAGTPTLTPSLSFRHEVIYRNKRCVLAYLYHRMRRLRDMRWQIGAVLPAEVTANIINPEAQWLKSYNRSLAVFMESIGENGFNVTTDLMPPKSLYIEVRCLTDYGRHEFKNGQTINFRKNTHHLLPREECEVLIRQGILEHISSS